MARPLLEGRTRSAPIEPTFSLVVLEQPSGRIVRRVDGVKRATVDKVVTILDAAGGLTDAVQTIGRAVEGVARLLAPPPAPPRRLRGRR